MRVLVLSRQTWGGVLKSGIELPEFEDMGEGLGCVKRRQIWVASTTAVAVTTGVLVFQGMTDRAESRIVPDGKAATVKSTAHTAQLATADEGRSASLPQRDTKPFSLLGVTWTNPSARVTGTVEVRTRSAESGKWTAWLQLDGDSGQDESGAARGGTEPAWVGVSDGVEVRTRSGAGTSTGLPAGLRLDMVDPGSSRATGIEPAAFAVEESTQPKPCEAPSDSVEPSQSSSAPETNPSSETPTEPATSEPPASSESPGDSPLAVRLPVGDGESHADGERAVGACVHGAAASHHPSRRLGCRRVDQSRAA
jgi:hypothetical protein